MTEISQILLRKLSENSQKKEALQREEEAVFQEESVLELSLAFLKLREEFPTVSEVFYRVRDSLYDENVNLLGIREDGEFKKVLAETYDEVTRKRSQAEKLVERSIFDYYFKYLPDDYSTEIDPESVGQSDDVQVFEINVGRFLSSVEKDIS
jgi:hypothetical protein